jgi:hypothetical protein
VGLTLLDEGTLPAVVAPEELCLACAVEPLPLEQLRSLDEGTC